MGDNIDICMSAENEDYNRAAIIYDDTCNLCRRSAAAIRARDRRGRFRLVSRQSAIGIELLKKYGPEESADASVVVVGRGKFLSKSEAILYIMRGLYGLRLPAAVLAIVPREIRDFLYDFIAARRYNWFRRRPGHRPICCRNEMNQSTDRTKGPQVM